MKNISNFIITKNTSNREKIFSDIFGYFPLCGPVDPYFTDIFVVLIFVFSVPKYIKITPRRKSSSKNTHKNDGYNEKVQDTWGLAHIGSSSSIFNKLIFRFGILCEFKSSSLSISLLNFKVYAVLKFKKAL